MLAMKRNRYLFLAPTTSGVELTERDKFKNSLCGRIIINAHSCKLRIVGSTTGRHDISCGCLFTMD